MKTLLAALFFFLLVAPVQAQIIAPTYPPIVAPPKPTHYVIYQIHHKRPIVAWLIGAPQVVYVPVYQQPPAVGPMPRQLEVYDAAGKLIQFKK